MVDEAMAYLTDAVFEPELKRGSGLDPSWYEDGVELVVVDDGSRDDTARIAIDLASRWEKKLQARRAATDEKRNWPEVDMRVIKLERNRGKGGAVRHGVLFARGRRILFADADGASRFSDLTSLQLAMDALLDASASSVKGPNGHARRRSMDGVFGKQSFKGDLVGHAMVAGSRAHLEKSQAVVQRSFVRNLLMHGFHVFVRTMGVSGIRDTQCGFKLFTRETARVLFPTMHLHRWSFDVELLLLASLVGIPVAEVPIDWHEVAGSKISVGWDGIGMARDLLVLRGNLLAGRWKVPRVVKASPLSKDQE
ncbi:hypothetical protein FFLO_06840 [Filobasidium floriforme]|uniref:dolichyl-phosphate beta-glucosyltransferase n=1 Tax=Filobasidium floriforme TaxID=5210 RepID=A0A8K0JJS0_9TREE|nr:hypothetical protein FFLO_06840 [Filobasidium floriforme]